MKTIMDDNKIIVFLNNEKIKDINIQDENELEDYLKSIFLKLNKKYDIQLNGYYEIIVYKDNNYGIILEIVNDELDYYDYFNQIDMKIIFSKVDSFLYEIKYEFLTNELLKNNICYRYLDKMYLKFQNMDSIKYSNLIELSSIIYGNKVIEILKYGKKVKL